MFNLAECSSVEHRASRLAELPWLPFKEGGDFWSTFHYRLQPCTIRIILKFLHNQRLLSCVGGGEEGIFNDSYRSWAGVISSDSLISATKLSLDRKPTTKRGDFHCFYSQAFPWEAEKRTKVKSFVIVPWICARSGRIFSWHRHEESRTILPLSQNKTF